MTWRRRFLRAAHRDTSRVGNSILALCVGAAALGLAASCEGRPGEPAAPTQPSTRPATATQPAAEVWKAGQPYICHRAKGKITIDKKDHPGEWAHAMVIQDFLIPISHKTPKSRTVARMLWDDEFLYVHVVAYDVDLRGTLKGQFARLWTEDAVELFLKPPHPDSGYYEFEMSPTNVLLDLQIPVGRHTSYERRASWESRSRLAVAVKGTIERPADTDERYRVLMAIPWKNLAYGLNRPPRAGERWRFIFARCDLSKAYGDEETPARQELSTCTRLDKVDFHMYDVYPEMRFSP